MQRALTLSHAAQKYIKYKQSIAIGADVLRIGALQKRSEHAEIIVKAIVKTPIDIESARALFTSRADTGLGPRRT